MYVLWRPVVLIKYSNEKLGFPDIENTRNCFGVETYRALGRAIGTALIFPIRHAS